MCWSGGKDSTASIILDHLNEHKIDLILITMLYFDKKRKIYAEHPEHIEFIFKAKKVFEDWGYKVVMLDGEHDYMYWFYKVRTDRCKNKENVGKYYGFLLSKLCKMNGEKVKPIQKYLKQIQEPVNEIVGIAVDEPERLKRAHAKGQISVLEENNYTEADAKRLCIEYDLLSPVYAFTKRQGCWFCPNATIGQLQHVYETHPELWAELENLSEVNNVVVKGFKRWLTLDQIKELFEDRKLRGCDSAS